jgi:hypothetical protein
VERALVSSDTHLRVTFHRVESATQRPLIRVLAEPGLWPSAQRSKALSRLERWVIPGLLPWLVARRGWD